MAPVRSAGAVPFSMSLSGHVEASSGAVSLVVMRRKERKKVKGGKMKDALYFSHDSNARHDRKILPMRTKYGAEGYGWYWMILEMMREEDGYRLSIAEIYDIDAYAMQMQCDGKELRKFIKDCTEKYKLFKSENGYIWSESLIRRMKVLEKRREQARAAARKRWDAE